MPDRLTPSQFAERFEADGRSLWCIAVAILGDRSLADDVVQEAAVVALRKLDDFTPGTSFKAWMGQIVRNIARNAFRRRGRSPVVVGDPDQLGRAGASDGRSVTSPLTSTGRLTHDQNAFDDTVVAALEELGETVRTCLLLRTVLELPYHEISVLLDIPEGTAMSHVHRSRHAMRRRLSAADPEGLSRNRA